MSTTTTTTARHAHTPGPWRHNPKTGHVILNGSASYAVRDRTADDGDPPRFNPADVQLMAAAPELLAAVEAAVQMLDRWSHVAGNELTETTRRDLAAAWLAGRQAIQAATRRRSLWSVTAIVEEWNPATGDFDEIDLDHETRAYDAEEAEDDARNRWSDHGYSPDRVKVRRID
jgi:hypothetical protein